MHSTSAGIVSGDEVPDGVPSKFHLVGEAMNTLMSYSEEKSMFGEAKYKELYDELVSNEKEWLEFFDHPMNVEHTGQTSLVLEELSRVYSGRKSWEEFGLVSEMLDKVMHILKQLVEAPGVDEGHKRAYEKTDHRIKMLHMEMKRDMGVVDIESVHLLKKLVNHESKYNLGSGIDQFNADQIYLNTWIMHKVAMEKRGYKNVSININEVADEDLLEQLTFTKEMMDKHPEHKASDEQNRKGLLSFGLTEADLAKEEKVKENYRLLFCACCNKQESVCGEYKKCGCGLLVYCNRACQRAHFKKHKKSCTKVKK